MLLPSDREYPHPVPAFTTILVSRFMLEFQSITQNRAHDQSLASFESVQFNHIVGSLGASLPAPGEVYWDAHDEPAGSQDSRAETSVIRTCLP
ncbi:hypothetical protein OH76DRAFT_103578 [Lentinus brumalis]|uniref:Uncharacterized protein n=1 Tax=Lentinus brumalis TaxID=2498619 RepID=A0A371CQ25_9APHY|nr:hypothetical protein OH76DRAFT_103578 [Polyporus brumalis]